MTEKTHITSPDDTLIDRLKATMIEFPDELASERIARNCQRAAEQGRRAEGEAFTADDALTLDAANGARLVIPVSELPCTIGRGSEADYVVDDDGVSRVHCELLRKGLLVGIRDQRSKNGTFVNGHRVASCCYLSAGDEIAIGELRFSISRV